MQITVDRAASAPIYRQIVDQVREGIRTGALPAGSRLPTVRQLAAEQGLTRLTVYSAYSELQAEGLVESHVGRGTFVASGGSFPEASRSPHANRAEWAGEGLIAELLRIDGDRDVISFAQAFPSPDAIPVRELGRAFGIALRRPGAFDYGPIQGLSELREAIASLLLDRGFSVPAGSVLVTNGAQQAIDIILRASTEEGETIAVEAPTYPGILELAALRRLRVAGVPSDDGGIRIDALEAACIAQRPRLLYLVPTGGNPTGRHLRADRRAEVLRLAREHDMLVIEDDTYGFLPLESPNPPALKRDDADDRVLFLTSFSKMLAPGLRLGALIASHSLLPRLAAAKGGSDLVSSSILQIALAEYLRHGDFLPHLRRVRDVYRERGEIMRSALARRLPQCEVLEPEAGLSVWVHLPDGVAEGEFVSDSLLAGVAVVPGRAFLAEPGSGPAMRLSFGMQTPERIERGVAILGDVLHKHLTRRSSMLALARGTAGPLV